MPKNDKQKWGTFFCKPFRIIKFFFLISQSEASLELKVVPTNRNSSEFLLKTNKTFSNLELFSIFFQAVFLELIFDTTIKTMFLNVFSSSFWGKPPWNQKLLPLTATARRSCYTLVRPFPNFFGTNFRHQNKNNVVETSYFGFFFFCLPAIKKYCVYYVFEHLKYRSRINEYWLNKNVCLNILLNWI